MHLLLEKLEGYKVHAKIMTRSFGLEGVYLRITERLQSKNMKDNLRQV